MQRQNNQVMLNLGTGATGEARNAGAQETEIGTAKACLERPAAAGPSMESIVERNNMRRALEQVRRNKGAPGADGMTVDALASQKIGCWFLLSQILTSFIERSGAGKAVTIC